MDFTKYLEATLQIMYSRREGVFWHPVSQLHCMPVEFYYPFQCVVCWKQNYLNYKKKFLLLSTALVGWGL